MTQVVERHFHMALDHTVGPDDLPTLPEAFVMEPRDCLALR